MVKRGGLALLLVIQALGGGGITLAHTRDTAQPRATVETSHDARCTILHDEVRCALCHYAGARVVVPQTLFASSVDLPALQFVPTERPATALSATYSTAPARGPPPHLS